MRNIDSNPSFSDCFFKRRAIVFSAGLLALLAPLGRAADALNYTKNYFVTGDAVTAGVGGVRGTGVNGFATTTITMNGVPCTGGSPAAIVPCATPGAVPAETIAAFLYWETVETTAVPGGANAFFDGNPIVGAVRGNPNNAPCWSSGGTGGSNSGAGRVYRADVRQFLPLSTSNVRLANGPHTIKLPDSGGGGNGNIVYADGASLVVVYKIVVPGQPLIAPLRAVAIYDGAFTLTKFTAAMTQNIGGFYDALGGPSTLTQIVANGQSGNRETLTINGTTFSNPFTGTAGNRWDNPQFQFSLASHASTLQTQLTSSDNQICLTWAAMVTSTPVTDTDHDGLLDTWETNGLHLNPGDSTHPATFGGCSDAVTLGDPCVNLPAMGANAGQQDIFLEIDWLHGTSGGDHTHIPKLAALNAIGAAFNPHHINLHFDVGNNYQTSGSPYIIPAAHAQGGEVVEESTLLCPNSVVTNPSLCAYTTPYSVLSWKPGFQSVRDGDSALSIPAHFKYNRKDIFHYALFGHAVGGPYDNITGKPRSSDPSSVSGVADRPGADLMVTLGLWPADDPIGCDPTVDCANQTGSVRVQAGTLMHELGHNLGLSHAGIYRTPNCEPNYPSVMNYLSQVHLLTGADGLSYLDYSSGLLNPLTETSLDENASLGPQTYRVRFYAPAGGVGTPATRHCDGTPITDGALMIRLETPGLSTPDWNNNGIVDASPYSQDVNFSGSLADGVAGGLNFVDSNDWASLNLQQISGRPSLGGLSSDGGVFEDVGGVFEDVGGVFEDVGGVFEDVGGVFEDVGGVFEDVGGVFEDVGGVFEDVGGVLVGDVDHVTTSSSPAPTGTAPGQLLAATPTLTSVILTWGPADSSLAQIDFYNIYRTTGPGVPPTKIGSTPSGSPPPTTYTDTVNGTTTLYNTQYTYFVTSVVKTTGVESGFSTPASATVKHLFVTALNPSRLYGVSPNPTLFTVTGLDLPAPATATCTTTATQYSPVGSYPITCSGPATTSNPVNGITYANGTLTIAGAPLTIAAVTNTKLYDGTTSAAATPTVTGLKGSDTVTGLAEIYDTKNAGTGKTLSVSSYTINDGNGGNNYSVTTTINTTGVINKKPVTAAISAANKTYDTTNTASITSCSLTGVLAGDVGNVTCSGSAGTFASANAGTWTVTATVSLGGSAAGNYVLTSTSPTTTATITRATPAVTVIGGTFMHDGDPHPATGTVTGIGGVLLGIPLFTYTPPGNSTAPVNVGSYLVTGSYPGNNNYTPATSLPAAIKIAGFKQTKGSMGTSRSFHTATLLGNGKVLVVGGSDGTGAALASSELYDPATDAFTPTANNMPNKAAGHTATLLTNGKVLVTGGGNASSQLYDPAANQWSAGGGMSSQRSYHTATALPNGKVLIAGGSTNNGTTTNSAQLYDPVSGSFSATGNMTVGRDFHTATLLTSGPNAGKVLIVGGRTSSGKNYTYLSTAELYNPATQVFTAVGSSLSAARYGHTAAVIAAGVNSGKVLIAGGASNAALSSAELYDPVAGTFSSAGSSLAAARQYFTATVISTGVLAAGGLNNNGRVASAEQYQGSAFVASDTMTAARAAHTATLLNDGSVLITGGQGSIGASIATAERFVLNP